MNKFLTQLIDERKKILPQFISFFEKRANYLSKLEIDSSSKFDFYLKFAYPNKLNSYVFPIHDLQKWLNSAYNIYSKIKEFPFEQLFQNETQSWDPMEKEDFKKWLSFYNEHGNEKYKKAQFYPESFASPNQLKAQLPIPQTNLQPKNPQQILTDREMKDLLVKKIQGIVARLNAAEKLATSDPEIRDILASRLDINLNQWLELLHQVKRMIQTAPIKNIYSSLLEDLIYKEATKLNKKGFIKTAKELIFLAQEAPQNPPANPPMPEPSVEPAKDEGKEAIDKLISGMNFEKPEDDNALIDPEPDDLANIRIMAQEAPPISEIPPPVPQQTPIQAPKEIVKDEILEEDASNKVDDFFDKALENITVQDIIEELELVANIFRTREIPRRLTRIDLMMDKLNIGAFFPIIGEASNKQLESNQYSLTRIEEVISKLRGAVSLPQDIHLGTGQEPTSNIGQQLAKEMEMEKALKEKRKKQTQMQEMQQGQSPAPQQPAPELMQAQPTMPAQAPVPPV